MTKVNNFNYESINQLLTGVKIIKKDETKEDFNINKVIIAVNKSASRVMVELSDDDINGICNTVKNSIIKEGMVWIPILTMHNLVETALDGINSDVAKSYRDYRNYKVDFVQMLDEVYQKSQKIRYIGDKENSNTDSTLVATKRSLIYNQLNKELYQRFFLSRDEVKACKEGFIYVHDMVSRLDSLNCCLFNMGDVLDGGFEMANVWYNEPKTLDTAFDVIGDVILSTAAQQYGGFTVPQLDKVLSKYAEKSFQKHLRELQEDLIEIHGYGTPTDTMTNKIQQRAVLKVQREFEQGFQGLEYKLNTVGSSRGDYPFITVTTGLATDIWGKMASETMLKVHMEGQGKDGFKKPVLFPKIVFLYDENLHGEGNELEDVFDVAIECSSKTMYPDFLSLTGEGYVPSMYKKYGEVISPMGKASLQPM